LAHINLQCITPSLVLGKLYILPCPNKSFG
jgi:hypothetical protein